MNATWRNVDWCLSRSSCWYKVREVARLTFLLLLAGWEDRTTLLLLDLGVHFDCMQLDIANNKKLSNEYTKALDGIDGVKYQRHDSDKESSYYTDAVIYVQKKGKSTIKSISNLLHFCGLIENSVNNIEEITKFCENLIDIEGDKSFAFETKCIGGSLKRGEIRRDMRKWKAWAKKNGLLIAFLWSYTSLIIVEVLPDSNDNDITPYCNVLKAYYWGKTNDTLKEDALNVVKKYHSKLHSDITRVFDLDNRCMFDNDPSVDTFNKWEFLVHGNRLVSSGTKFDPSLKENDNNGVIHANNGWIKHNPKSLDRNDIKNMESKIDDDAAFMDVVPDSCDLTNNELLLLLACNEYHDSEDRDEDYVDDDDDVDVDDVHDQKCSSCDNQYTSDASVPAIVNENKTSCWDTEMTMTMDFTDVSDEPTRAQQQQQQQQQRHKRVGENDDEKTKKKQKNGYGSEKNPITL
jgi:hypothetical protein